MLNVEWKRKQMERDLRQGKRKLDQKANIQLVGIYDL